MSAKRTLLLYTGGTLGMKVDSMGRLFPAPGFLADSLNRMDELKSQNFPSWTLLEYDPLVDSSTFTAENWVAIAKDIEKHYDDFDGFVILTGTDTMAYTASALSFMITGLSKPVVFTGSQIPMERPFNDARRNLITSILISVDDRTPNEVCLFFNDSLLRGNRAIKISSNGLDAFSSPSYPAFARLSAFHLKYNHDQYWLDEREGSRFLHSFEVDINPEESGLKICTQADADIAVICMTPTYRDSTLMALLSSPTLRGIVLQLYGSGNIPTNKKGFKDFIQEVYNRGIVLCIVTQCLYGGITSPSPYAVVSLQFYSMGVVPGGDMTTEAAVTKMASLLGQYPNDISKVRLLLGKNLRGEMTNEWLVVKRRDLCHRRENCDRHTEPSPLLYRTGLTYRWLHTVTE